MKGSIRYSIEQDKMGWYFAFTTSNLIGHIESSERYITEQDALDSLLEKLYEHMLKEFNPSH